ncbi:MAG: tubulin-like doman-containing protein, partial [Terriglobia bacterium]
MTFHICCGLAGGTGSGSLIDVVSQVRNLYRESRNYRIIVYALLPDQFPKANWDTGNYHANGHAALLELNALSVNAFQPHNVAGNGDRLQLPDPFNGCYLFTNQNVNGLQVDVDKELPNIVADFLFQKIAAATAANWSTLARMENAENGDGTPESRPGANIGERSKRFLAFGIKRLAIPEEEIREYLTYKFARQAALQLRFNNWSDTLGFLDEPRNQDFGEFVKQKETQERWLISDDHLSLSRGILPEEISNKKWKPINQEWMDVIPQYVSLVQERDKAGWLNELEKLCAQRFEDGYRGLGARKFYETKLAARKEHVREIRRRAESEIFEEWKNGVKSMHDISRLTNALVAALDERLKNVDNRILRAKENEEVAETKVKANRAEWAKVGFLSDMLGKRQKLLDAQGECLRDLYIYRTQGEAWNFAKKLLQDLITEITRLGTDVHNCAALIDESIKEFNERIAHRCNDEKIDLRQSVVRFYKPDKVKEFGRDLDKDQTEQNRQAQGVRLALIEQLGESPGFATFHARIAKQRFFDVLEQKCETSATAAHDNLIATNKERNPLFGVNIVGTLEREFSGNEEGLRTFIHDLVSMAGNYLDFDPAEVNRSAPGIPAGIPTRVSQFMVIIPKAQEYVAFAENLKTLFRQQLRGDIPTEVIENDAKPNEITLVGVTNLFPLRYAKPLAFLKERYEKRLSQTDKPARVKLELHCEGDGSQYPELFVPSREKLLDKALPYVILAKTLQIIKPLTNQATGSTDLFLVEQDEYGLPKRTKLGRGLTEMFDSLDTLVA